MEVDFSKSRNDVESREAVLFRRLLRLLGAFLKASLFWGPKSEAATGGFPSVTPVERVERPSFNLAGFCLRPNHSFGMDTSSAARGRAGVRKLLLAALSLVPK